MARAYEDWYRFDSVSLQGERVYPQFQVRRRNWPAKLYFHQDGSKQKQLSEANQGRIFRRNASDITSSSPLRCHRHGCRHGQQVANACHGVHAHGIALRRGPQSYHMRFLHASAPPVIHGDLKAQNVLIDHQVPAKVADFGLSQKSEGGTGTPYWMARKCDSLLRSPIPVK